MNMMAKNSEEVRSMAKEKVVVCKICGETGKGIHVQMKYCRHCHKWTLFILPKEETTKKKKKKEEEKKGGGESGDSLPDEELLTGSPSENPGSREDYIPH